MISNIEIGITKENIKKAEDNGVSYNTFKNRVKYLGWDVERAMTVKPLTPSQAGLRKKGESTGSLKM